MSITSRPLNYEITETLKPLAKHRQDFTIFSHLDHDVSGGHRDQFARCLTEKLLTYSMGRTLEASGGPEVDHIVAALKQRRGLRDLALLVASSETFQHK